MTEPILREENHNSVALRLRYIIMTGIVLVITATNTGASPPVSKDNKASHHDRFTVLPNDQIQVSIDPNHGAAICSLQFGSSPKESTNWRANHISGLLQEVHSRHIVFKQTERSISPSEISVTYEGQMENLRIRRKFIFPRNTPHVKVEFTFTNIAPFPLRGQDAPTVLNLFAPAGGKQKGAEYYCTGGESYPPSPLIADDALAIFNDLAVAPYKPHWIGTTDPVSRRGIAVVFRDSAVDRVIASRNTNGDVLYGWRYRELAAGETLHTALSLIPIDGLSALTYVNEKFALDSMITHQNSHVTLETTIIALGNASDAVSIINRAYGTGGQEGNPLETLVFNMPTKKDNTGRISLPGEDQKPAWLLQQIYITGRKDGQFLVEITGNAPPPDTGWTSLPPATSEITKPETAPTGEDSLPLVAWQFNGLKNKPVDENGIRLILSENERETAIVGLTAGKDIANLKAGMAHPPNTPSPLPASATYLWSTEAENVDSSNPILVPAVTKTVSKGRDAVYVITVDATELDAGEYLSYLYIGADKQIIQIPVHVTVYPVDITQLDNFGMWWVEDRAHEELPGNRLASYGVNRITRRLSRNMPQPPAMIKDIENCGYYEVRTGSRPANRTFSAQRKLDGGKDNAPGLLLWSDIYSPSELEDEVADETNLAVVVRNIHEAKSFSQSLEQREITLLMRDGIPPDIFTTQTETQHTDLWAFMDMRDCSWQRAMVLTRQVFLATAWKNARGVGIISAPPASRAGSQSLLWHILRDARDEAVIYAAALQKKEINDITGRKQKNSNTDSVGQPAIKITETQCPYGPVLRAQPVALFENMPLLAFREQKESLLKTLSD